MKEGNVQPVLEGHALASAADEKNIVLITKKKKKLIKRKIIFFLLVYERALLVRRGTGAHKTAVPQVST